jgi:autotransporter-associated beta strand protein
VLAGGAIIDSSTNNGTISTPLTGAGGLTKLGTATLTLSGANAYTGATAVNNGTLLVNGSVSGNVTVFTGGTLGGTGTVGGTATVQSGGTFAPGAGVGTLTLSSLALNAGSTSRFELNTSLSPSNDLASVSGTLTCGGDLVVTNVGPALLVGETFKLFSQPASGFSSVHLPAGYTWQNTLAADGSITVLTVIPTVPVNPTNISVIVTNGQIGITWPTNYTGWTLLAQTNALSTGLVTNVAAWHPVPGSSATNEMFLPINPANPTVFFRLVYTNAP